MTWPTAPPTQVPDVVLSMAQVQPESIEPTCRPEGMMWALRNRIFSKCNSVIPTVAVFVFPSITIPLMAAPDIYQILIVFLVPYFCYTLEWLSCGTHMWLKRRERLREETLYGYVERLKKNEAEAIHFSAKCFHYERGGAGGEDSSSAERKVVTHEVTEEFSFNSTVDDTSPIPFLDCSVTKLYLKKEYTFLNEDTKDRHDAQFAAFKAANESDKEQEYSANMEIPDFQEHSLCFITGEVAMPWWLEQWVFILSSVLLLTLPYRLKVDMSVGSVKHSIVKKVGL